MTDVRLYVARMWSIKQQTKTRVFDDVCLSLDLSSYDVFRFFFSENDVVISTIIYYCHSQINLFARIKKTRSYEYSLKWRKKGNNYELIYNIEWYLLLQGFRNHRLEWATTSFLFISNNIDRTNEKEIKKKRCVVWTSSHIYIYIYTRVHSILYDRMKTIQLETLSFFHLYFNDILFYPTTVSMTNFAFKMSQTFFLHTFSLTFVCPHTVARIEKTNRINKGDRRTQTRVYFH